uniref:Uncharacterized protein n=1 Tax=Anopheles atroparvus TaxID=41427 RepID=A0AAG5D0R6_ANOAO
MDLDTWIPRQLREATEIRTCLPEPWLEHFSQENSPISTTTNPVSTSFDYNQQADEVHFHILRQSVNYSVET